MTKSTYLSIFGNFGNVMIISWLLENSTLYVYMDFCILLGTGVNSI